MEATAQACGSYWLTVDTILQAWASRGAGAEVLPVWEWPVEMVATFVFFYADGISLAPGAHQIMLDKVISGATWMTLTEESIAELELAVFGLARSHHEQINAYIDESFRGPPAGPDGGPILVYLHYDVQRLIEVSPPDHFEVEAFVSISWEDPRISRMCAGVPLDSEVKPSDPCTIFWRPVVEYPTALVGEDAPTIVEDYGTSFFVGADSTNPGAAIPGLAKSFGSSFFRLRAKFLTVMNYRRYPYDAQTFNFSVRSSTASYADKVQFVSTGALSIASKDEHAVWDVASIDSYDYAQSVLPSYDEKTRAYVLEKTKGNSPIFSFFENGLDDFGSELEFSLAVSEYTLRLQRYCGYYLGNYIFLETILVLLGWVTFFISPESIDARLGIGLTLVLAINVFQIVLVENLPETGYMTDLSLFTICNTVMLALMCMETVVVCEAYRTTKQMDAIISSTKIYKNNKEAVAAAVTIQRYHRGQQWRQPLRESRRRSVDPMANAQAIELTPSVASHSGSGFGVRAHGEGVSSSKSEKAALSPQPPPEPKRKLGGYKVAHETVTKQWNETLDRMEEQQGKSTKHRSGKMFRSKSHDVRRARNRFRMYLSKLYLRHVRKIASEGDKVSALVIFPSIFLLYTCIIFARGGESKSGC